MKSSCTAWRYYRSNRQGSIMKQHVEGRVFNHWDWMCTQSIIKFQFRVALVQKLSVTLTEVFSCAKNLSSFFAFSIFTGRENSCQLDLLNVSVTCQNYVAIWSSLSLSVASGHGLCLFSTASSPRKMMCRVYQVNLIFGLNFVCAICLSSCEFAALFTVKVTL